MSTTSHDADLRTGKGFSHAWRALRHRNFRLFMTGQGISLIGSWMTRLALSWLTYRLTGSPLLLGLVGFSGQIGAAILSPFAGVWVDRLDRRKLLVGTQALSAMQSLALAFLTLRHVITIHEILALAAVQGLIDAFDMPGRQTFMIQMVGSAKEDLGNAIALNSSMVNAARLVGPAVAGLVIAKLGEGYCFLIDGISYFAVIVSLLMMRLAGRVSTGRDHEGIGMQMREGWRYVSTFQPVRTILLLFAVSSIMGMPFVTLLPVFASRVLHGGAHTLAYLTTASGVGALSSALVLALRRSVRGLTRTLLYASLLFGASLVGFGASHTLWISLLCIAFTGFGMMQGLAGSNTIIQTVVPEERRGRVMGYYTLAFAGMMPFGSLLAGYLAQHIGASHTVMLTGSCVLLGAVWYATQLRELRRELLPVYLGLGLTRPEPDTA